MVLYKAPSLDEYTYPGWAQALGWLITLFPLSFIVFFFFYRYCKDGGWQVSRNHHYGSVLVICQLSI